jgi:hypothetical protein
MTKVSQFGIVKPMIFIIPVGMRTGGEKIKQIAQAFNV